MSTADEGAGHRVEPRGVDDGVELERLVGRVDPRLRDGGDRVLAQVDESHVRQVERVVVTAVEAHPLGRDGVVRRAQRVGRVRVLDDGADPLVEEGGDRVVGGAVDDEVGEPAAERQQMALRPRRVEPRPPLLLGQHGDGLLRDVHRHTGQRPARRLAVRVTVLGDLRQPLGGSPGRCGPASRSSACAGTPPARRPPLAISGIDWMPDEPVPMTPTRLPVKSTPSCGQRLVK